MSWSLNCIGSPEAVEREIERYSGTLSGQSKVEFDDAKPLIIGLVKQNFNKTVNTPVVIELSASGSGWATGGEQNSRDCGVSVKRFYGNIVT